MKLAEELGKTLAKAYRLQNECGPNHLSALIWDAWRGVPVDPNDPIPFVKTLLGRKISLKTDRRITRLSKDQQKLLYQKAFDHMWDFIHKETGE